MSLLFGGMSSEAWSMQTYVFYLMIIFTCFLSAFLYSGVRFQWIGHREAANRIQVALPMLLLLFVKGFSICGTDVEAGYRLNFDTATSFSGIYDWTLENGYKFLCVLIRNLTTNYSVFLFVVAIITVFPVYYVMQKYREYLDVPITVMVYAAIYYFQGLSLLRIFIAASFCLLSFDAIIEKKYVFSIIFVVIASLFHVTSIIMLLPCFFMGLRVSKKIILAGLAAVIVVLVVSRYQLALIMTGRYSVYGVSTELSFGMEVVYYYVPLIMLFFLVAQMIRNNKINDMQKRLFEISFIWVLLGAFIGVLSYVIPIFGRMYVFTIPVVLFLGVSLQITKQISPKLFYIFRVAVMCYLLFRFQIYINGYYELDGIMPYKNCFGWIL